jgi:winged helix DNA-binding protein
MSARRAGRPQVLGRRALNRATLARQLLLERVSMDVEDALEWLVGMQAQLPNAPFVALWSRLEGFRPEALSALVADRRAVRMTLLRGTIHLVTARDGLRLRPVLQPALERDVYRNTTFGGHRLAGLDMTAVLAAGRDLVADQPLTNAQLRDALALRWPDRDPAALAYAVRCLLPMVHVPPRGIWQRSGPIALTTVETWLGRPVDASSSPDAVVLRYLAAYGPSTVADAQAWSRLTGLRDAFERLRPGLVTFADERGRELFDLPDAPRPDPDTPAPPRFLPEYDNVLLAHADRTRFVEDDLRRQISGQRFVVGSVLVDGRAGATWTSRIERNEATLSVRPIVPLSDADRVGISEEGERLLSFLAPDAGRRRVGFAERPIG